MALQEKLKDQQMNVSKYPYMSVLMEMTVVEIVQSGPKWWTNRVKATSVAKNTQKEYSVQLIFNLDT